MAIPLLAGVLISVGSSLLTWLITRVIALLGIGFITVVGVKPLLTWATQQIQSLLNISTPEWFPIIGWLGVMKLDICVSVMLSAVLAKLMLAGLTASGGLRRMHFGSGKD